MKCKICKKKLKQCIYDNENCEVERHWECKEHYNNIGLGCVDPCYMLEIKDGGKIGIGTTTPKTLIHLKCTKEQWKKDYSGQGKFGIWLLKKMGVLTVEFYKEDD